MAKEARDLEAFFSGIEGAEALAGQAGDLAVQAEAKGLLSIKGHAKVELPQGVRTETLIIGTMSKEALRAAFRQRGIKVTSDAEYLIDRTEFRDKPQDIKLAWSSGRDLGLTKSTPYRGFCEAGQDRGYSLNRAEVGLYLRLQDTNQPLNDWYWVAMEPMADRYGRQFVFGLGRSQDGVWLNADWARPGDGWDPEYRLVFSLSK